MNIAASLSSAAETLQKAGIAEPVREARSLLAVTLQKDAAYLVAHPEYELTADEVPKYERFLTRRANREPFQYITRHQEFYHLDFEVTPDVLIPRPETEILVEAAIEVLSSLKIPRFCEIGVGSGCVSVAILRAVEKATAVSVDISEPALAVARRNAEKHGVDRRLALRTADLFVGMNEMFDLVVSNPPYIRVGDLDSLQLEVRDFEPRTALDGGPDGLDVVNRIIAGSPAHLRPGNYLLMEIGFDQSIAVSKLFDPAVWSTLEFLPDLQGIPRVTRARLNGPRRPR